MKKETPTGISASVRSARNPSEPVIGDGTTPPLRRAAALVRSATSDPVQIQRQQDEIVAFAARENFELKEMFVFDGVGGNDDRPIEMILKRKSECDSFDFLIITEITRLTRAVGGMRPKLQRLESAGIVVVTVNAGILASDADDRAIMAYVKQLSRKICGHTIPASYLIRRNLLPRKTPYGIDRLYRDRQTLEPLFIVRSEDDGSRSLIHPKTSAVMLSLPAGCAAIRATEKQTVELVPGDPSKIETVKYIFDCYTKLGLRWSPQEVAAHLNQIQTAGIKGTRWTPLSINTIIRNPVYLGYTLHGHTRNLFRFRDAVREMRRRSNWVATEHPKLKSAFMALEQSNRLWLLMQEKLNAETVE